MNSFIRFLQYASRIVSNHYPLWFMYYVILQLTTRTVSVYTIMMTNLTRFNNEINHTKRYGIYIMQEIYQILYTTYDDQIVREEYYFWDDDITELQLNFFQTIFSTSRVFLNNNLFIIFNFFSYNNNVGSLD